MILYYLDYILINTFNTTNLSHTAFYRLLYHAIGSVNMSFFIDIIIIFSSFDLSIKMKVISYSSSS